MNPETTWSPAAYLTVERAQCGAKHDDVLVDQETVAKRAACVGQAVAEYNDGETSSWVLCQTEPVPVDGCGLTI